MDFRILARSLADKNRTQLDLILNPIFQTLATETRDLDDFLRLLLLHCALTEEERDECVDENGVINAVTIYDHLIQKEKGREMILALTATRENERIIQLIGRRLEQFPTPRATLEFTLEPAEQRIQECLIPNEQNAQIQNGVGPPVIDHYSDNEDEDDENTRAPGLGPAVGPGPGPGLEANVLTLGKKLRLWRWFITIAVGFISTLYGLSAQVAPYLPNNIPGLPTNFLFLNPTLNLTFEIPPIHHPTCPRDFFLSEIHKSFVDLDSNGHGDDDNLLRVSVMTGKAGSGKSEIFKLYAQSQAHFYCRVVWIDGRNTNTIEESIAGLYQTPELNITSNSNSNLSKKEQIEEMLEKIYAKLLSDSCPTLLMFDDFDSQRADLKISSFLPKPKLEKQNPNPDKNANVNTSFKEKAKAFWNNWTKTRTKMFVLVNTQNPDLPDYQDEMRHELLLLDELTIEESTDCIQRQLDYQMTQEDILMLARQQKGLVGNVVKAVKSLNEELKEKEVQGTRKAMEKQLHIPDAHLQQSALTVIQPNHTAQNVQVNLTAFFSVLDKVGDRPFVILSINGASRTGKSFLLSYFLKYLKSYSNSKDSDWFDIPIRKEFTWRGGATRETIGCHMWSEPFLLNDSKGREIAILLMDSQGLFDGRTSRKENNQIFTLSSILSTVMIYNVMGQVDDSTVSILQEHLREASIALGPHKIPRLLVLIRDFMHTDEFNYGHHYKQQQQQKSSLKNYYHQFFNPSLRSEILSARKEVESTFDEFGFFLLPHPGQSFLKASSPSALDPKFKRQLKEFITLVTSGAEQSTKKVFDEEVTGLEYKKYLENSIPYIKAPGDDLTDWNEYYKQMKQFHEQQKKSLWKKMSDGIKIAKKSIFSGLFG